MHRGCTGCRGQYQDVDRKPERCLVEASFSTEMADLKPHQHSGVGCGPPLVVATRGQVLSLAIARVLFVTDKIITYYLSRVISSGSGIPTIAHNEGVFNDGISTDCRHLDRARQNFVLWQMESD